MRCLSFLALALAAGACGGSSPTAPSPAQPQPAELRFEIEAFQPGAIPSAPEGTRVSVSQTLASGPVSAPLGADGVARLADTPAPGAAIVVEGDGRFPSVLRHECRETGNPHPHKLWVVQTPDEKELVRWMAFGGEYAENATIRITESASVILSEELRNDPRVVAAQEWGANLVSELLRPHGLAFYTRDAGGALLTAALPGTVPVEVVVEPDNCPGGACTHYVRVVSGRITAVKITYFSAVNGRSNLHAAHEFGHALGLSHSTDPFSLMGSATGIRVQDIRRHFTPLEKRVVEYLFSRPPRTRWEDTFPR